MIDLDGAARQFISADASLVIKEFGNGNINRTFLVSPPPRVARPFLLQRLNTHVFQRPELVMANICAITDHVNDRLAKAPGSIGRRWEIPAVLKTAEGHDHWRSRDGSFWRAISFIEGSWTLNVIGNPTQARDVGFSLGTFHRLLSDLPPEKLADTLPGFHVTPGYLRRFDKVISGKWQAQTPEERWCLEFIAAHRSQASVLEDAHAAGRLKMRTIHGDPKVNNVLFDVATGQACSVIDLDTVKPGLVQYDIGDCLRSSCNRLGEETADWEQVRFDPELGEFVLTGYCTVAREFLSEADFALIPDAIGLIAFELGLRFFTDHCEGNVYFKANHPRHNLARALVQFKLAESVGQQTGAIRAMLTHLQ